MDRLTRAAWLMVAEFGVAVAAIAVWWMAVSSMMEPIFGGDPLEFFGLSSSTVISASTIGLISGVVWMIRIARGPRDEPPPWRYRDQ